MSHTLLTTTKHRIRRAVTLVEVIFAIGVVLIGLVGLLSILPLAGRRADDALGLNSGAQLAESVIDELLVRKFLSNGRLRDLNSNFLNTSVTSTSSFAIDPMFCSIYEDQVATDQDLFANPPTSTSSGYDPTLFPYYKVLHNPSDDPSSNPTGSNSQPRMLRVGIGLPPPNNTTAGPAFIDKEQALALVEDVNDLDVIRDRGDRARPARLQALQSGLEYGKRVPAGVYSWIATVNPMGGGFASIAVVVIRNRSRDFDVPTSQISNAFENPEENRVGERVANVTFASGFQGGAGGVVHLEGSLATVSRLRANDWIMLSRSVGSDNIHRWFRIVGLDGDPSRNGHDMDTQSPT